MIRSMTGFGEAQFEESGHAFHVELRSVNNRYLKTTLRLPDEFAFLEAPLENALRQRLTRGSVTLRLTQRDLSESAAQDINIRAVQHYLSQLREVAGGANFTIDLANIAMLPGVCQPHELSEELRERFGTRILSAAAQAVDALLAMRAVEGQALATDLTAQCDAVAENLKAIASRAPLTVQEYRDRLMSRVRELVAGSNITLAEEHLLREVSVYAERSDIREEIVRLTAHLAQFAECIASKEPSGRKLDFIAQEMLREANTIGSKSGDPEIARRTIDIKSAIDRIKEQVQNVE